MIISLADLTSWLTHFGYWVLFPLTVVEGPIITVIAGSLAALGVFNFIVVYLIVVLGDLVGDSIQYAIGRYGGKKFIEKWGYLFRIKPDQVISLKNHFEAHPGKTLFLGKISHGIGSIFLIGAGMAEMSFVEFIAYNFLATIVKSLILLGLGYYFGQALAKINSISQLLTVFFIIVLIGAVTYYLLRRKKRLSKKNIDGK